MAAACRQEFVVMAGMDQGYRSATVKRKSKNIDAELLGKIVLARFLELPLQKFERLVRRLEASTEFAALRSAVTPTCLPGARFAKEGRSLSRPAAVLGEVRETGPEFVYRHTSYAREYHFDDEAVKQLATAPDSPGDVAGAFRRLRLINSRNRLTHVLIQGVLEYQAEYLRTGQPLALKPFSQAAISARLRSDPELPVVADPGRLSRLVRGLAITLPGGKTIPLRGLFPKPRQVHCHYVDHMIKKEKTWLLQGVLQEPLTDEGIAEYIGQAFGSDVSRRTVANIRHDLAIPDYRSRAQRLDYLAATAGFSQLVPLTRQTLHSLVPPDPGVYEIRTLCGSSSGNKRTWLDEEGARSGEQPVVYIGSSSDLNKRLADHLRGSSGNALLHRYVAAGVARVRFRLIDEGWRRVERELYRVFCETFGAPPLCNRMSP